jgi:hypothetical protein
MRLGYELKLLKQQIQQFQERNIKVNFPRFQVDDVTRRFLDNRQQLKLHLNLHGFNGLGHFLKQSKGLDDDADEVGGIDVGIEKGCVVFCKEGMRQFLELNETFYNLTKFLVFNETFWIFNEIFCVFNETFCDLTKEFGF